VPTFFDHSIEGSCSEQEFRNLPGAEYYSSRVLGATNPGDLVQLHPDLRDEFSAISGHYDRSGLSHATDVVWERGLDGVRRYANHAWNVYYFSHLHNQVREDTAWCLVAEEMNSKNRFVKSCWANNIPVPSTKNFQSVRAADFRREELEFPAFLKLEVSASGEGVWPVNSRQELLERLVKVPRNCSFQIQQAITATFLNVQYTASDGVAYPIVVTEQILKGAAHSGNRYPTKWSPFPFCQPLAQLIAQKGMRGIFAFDVAVLADGSFRMIECNPRWNGSSYPTRIAQKLGLDTWIAKTIHVGCRRIADLNLELEYSATTKQGIVLVKWGTILEGEISFLVTAPTHLECEELANRFQQMNS